MIALLVLGVPALIVANAFFVAAEYALVRSRLDRVEALEQEGAAGAALVHRQIDRIDEYIAACQVGITFTSIGIGAVGEPVLAHYLKDPLGGPLAGDAWRPRLACTKKRVVAVYETERDGPDQVYVTRAPARRLR